MGLVRFEGELVMLSAGGTELRADRSMPALLQVLREQILGVEELLELLEVGPSAIDALNTASVRRDWTFLGDEPSDSIQTPMARERWCGHLDQGKWTLTADVPLLANASE